VSAHNVHRSAGRSPSHMACGPKVVPSRGPNVALGLSANEPGLAWPTVVIVVVRSVVSSRSETAAFRTLPRTRRSCANDQMCQGWRSHLRGDVEDALYAADRAVRHYGKGGFGQAAPGLVGLWLLALVCAPRSLLSATPMPFRASFSKAMMSDTTNLSYPSASP
jgi:hypothetical protein